METWIVIALTLLIVKVLCNPLNSGDPVDPLNSGDPVDPLNSGDPVEVTYSDLETLGTSCYPSDSCQKNETSFGLYPHSCDCDSSCSLYDTCCVDSEFRVPKSSSEQKHNSKCFRVNNNPGFEIFMVDSCKNDETSDNLCFSNPEDSNDPFLMIPFTSEVTRVTYKNYFCAVCNEEIDSEQLQFWDMEIWGSDAKFVNFSEPLFKFNKTMKSWTVNEDKHNETLIVLPVTLKILKHWQAPVRYCSLGLIENCSSNWTDELVAIKCGDYMANVIGSQNVRYRNPHCALCNFENLSNLQCVKFEVTGISINAFAPASSSRPSSSVGVDIPLISLFVLEDRQKRCGKHMVYDKFADKCRCNSRIYKKENGKCVHRI